MTGKTISHYQILEKLGEGGMGVVYKARDLTLNRIAALKFLSPAKTFSDERKRRFLHEAQTASALNHPHIVTIYEFASHEGQEFLAMESVEGKTLDKLIPKHGLRLGEALDYAIQIADALARAHAAGILHRDLKPGNVIANKEGQVKVLDFGLAKLTEHSPPDETDSTRTAPQVLTEEGTIVGTASYMSPEQAEGKKLDARSDIFSFGAVLYELLTGQRAFQGDSRMSTLAAIIREEPKSVSEVSAGVPPEVGRIVARCLRKDPARRFQTMADLKVALAEAREESESGSHPAAAPPRAPRRLAWWAAGIAVALAAVAIAAFLYFRRPPLTERDSIVLADFVNTTGDPVFDGALKQALSTSLNQSPYLNVLPDERVVATLRLMGRSPEERVAGRLAREVCERAGVKALLAGSITAVGTHYTIGLDAVNCSTGDTLAQEQVEAGSKDQVLGALGQAASRMRRKLGESLASIRKLNTRIEEATTSSLEALKAYSLGREQHSRGRYREAMPFHRRAIELDPNFARAYLMLGWANSNAGEKLAAEPFITKAFELRQRVSERERLSIEAAYLSQATGELDKAAGVHRVWTQMYPRDVGGVNNWGLICQEMGQHEKAAELFREGLSLSGGDAVFRLTNAGNAYVALNRYAEAKAMFDQAVAKFDTERGHASLYRLAWIEGDAAGMERQVAWSQGQRPEILLAQAVVAAFGGQLQRSRDLRRRVVEMAKRGGGTELPASYSSAEAVFEAQIGNLPRAKEEAAAALGLARSRGALFRAALVEALAGSAGPAKVLLDELTKRYPLDTLVNNVAVPVAQAALETYRGNPRRAVELLERAAPYELGAGVGCENVLYVRGEAHLKAGSGNEAAAAFQKILDHRGIFVAAPHYSLAWLGLGRAQALAANTAAARKAYQDFLAAWKDADPDVPILKQARQEYAKLPQ